MSRVQKYNVSFDVLLRDRGDYGYVSERLRSTVMALMESTTGVQIDGFIMTKVPDKDGYEQAKQDNRE